MLFKLFEKRFGESMQSGKAEGSERVEGSGGGLLPGKGKASGRSVPSRRILPMLAGVLFLSCFPAVKGWAAGIWEKEGDLWYYYEVPDKATGSNLTATGSNLVAEADGAERKQYNGWIKADKREWYYCVDSRMMTGWVIDGGKWYYMGEDGKMLYNQWVDNFYLGPDGAALTGGTAPDGTRLSDYGSRIVGTSAVEELDSKTANYVQVLKDNPEAYVEFTDPGDMMNERRGTFHYVTYKRMNLYDPYTGQRLYTGDGCFRVDAVLEQVKDGQINIIHPSDLFRSPKLSGVHIYTDPAGFISRVTQ